MSALTAAIMTNTTAAATTTLTESITSVTREAGHTMAAGNHTAYLATLLAVPRALVRHDTC
jgi:hypothetical protein